jgi:hypothetical protein
VIYSAGEVSSALGTHIPEQNVASNWPLIVEALEALAISSRACEVAAAATVAVETGTFAPIKERGGPAYFEKLYWLNQEKAKELGNLSADDAANFRGRGFVQITGRSNYQHFGEVVGADLVASPELALDPAISARVLAAFFRERRVYGAAEAGNWERVRRRVNGGLNGWADFSTYVKGLNAIHPPHLVQAFTDVDPVAPDVDGNGSGM